MSVARNNQIRLRGNGTRQDMIIVGIILYNARHANRCDGVGHAPQVFDNFLRCQPRLRQTRRNFFSREHILQLGQQYRADTQLEYLSSCRVDQTTWRAT